VSSNHQVRLKSITEGRDFGTSIEVLSGVATDDDVILNPPDSISDGASVRIAPPPPGHS
jgi:hypothetical protein